MSRVLIEARFNGPADSGNGGYCAGLIATAIGESVKIRLAQPVPIDRALEIAPNTSGGWDVHADPAGERALIATATPHVPIVDVPPPPSWVEASGVAQHFVGFAHHSFPRCFVCGPERDAGDGLRIFPGSIPGTQQVAAPWQPDASLGDSTGHVRPEFVWAALDCPGYFSSCSPAIALLGEISVRIDRQPRVGESCVVTAWPIAVHGRKHTTGTALFTADGQCAAVGIATWIVLKN